MLRSFKTTLILSLSTLALAACQQADAPVDDTPAVESEKAEWGYGADDGPAQWGDLSEDYAQCKTGKEQSPIDLPSADKANTIDIATNYAATSAEVINNGHAIEVKFNKGFTLTSGKSTYELLQFHYHTPSENTVEGKSYPLTAHFVHADAEGNLAVLGLLYEEGAASEQVQATIDNIGGKANLNIAAMLPDSKTVYNFKGSLTTPPCSEGVNWHVLTTPVTANKEQIEALNKLMGDNARPVQPMNDRVI